VVPPPPPGSGSSPNFAHLNWIPNVPENKWRYIVVHHSGAASGDAAVFDAWHKQRGWEGLGYHFVIGNGSLTRDGLIEIGFRWTQQKAGAHAGVRGHPEFNEFGIGICLVGDFNQTRPTETQMASLTALVRALMQRYNIPKSRVVGHGMLKSTDCPGKNFPFKDFYSRL
jgi:N-acetyl-anhydromuramyl-L-alanine amidase AmpD